jgi:hypothetical protein
MKLKHANISSKAARIFSVEAASTDEVAKKFNARPLIREGYLQPPMIVPLKPYSGFAPRF